MDISELGKEAYDKVTGFTGIITAKTIYLGLSVKYLITAKSEENKKPIEEWFYSNRIEITSTGDEIGNTFGYKKNKNKNESN
jgi:hypothetical protein